MSLLKMFGMDGFSVIDMVPAGTVQDMVRANAADVLPLLITLTRQQYDVAKDERISLQFIEHVNAKGEPTIMVLPQVLTEGLVLKRKLPYYDLVQFLRTAPIAEWITTAKEAAKMGEKMEALLTQLAAATAKGDTKKVRKLEAQVKAAVAQLPPGVVKALGLAVPVDAVPAVAQLPEKTAEPAAETGDTQTPPATDGAE